MALSCSPHAITALTFRADRLPRPIPKKYPPFPRFPYPAPEKALRGEAQKRSLFFPQKIKDAPRTSTGEHHRRKADTKKAVSLLQLTACFRCGAPEEIRTPGLQVRSLLLYPAELRARREGVLIEMRTACQQSWEKKTIFFERLLRGAVSGRHLVGSPHPRRLAEKAFHPIRGYRQDAGRAPTGLPDSEKEALPASPIPCISPRPPRARRWKTTTSAKTIPPRLRTSDGAVLLWLQKARSIGQRAYRAGSAAEHHNCRCRSGRWTWPHTGGKPP